MPQSARRKNKEKRELEHALNRASGAIRACRAGDTRATAEAEDALEDVGLLRGVPFKDACAFVQEQRFLLEDGERFVDEVGEALGWPKW